MIVLAVLLCCLFVSVYLYVTRHYNYWKDAGVFYLKPSFPTGNLADVFFLRSSIGEHMAKIYRDHPEHRYVGVYFADMPYLVIRDYELALRITTQDFHYFSKRTLDIPKKTDLHGARSLFSIHSTEWKNSRAKLSPIFTSKKQKVAFDCTTSIGEKIRKKFTRDKTFELRTLATCIASDLISDGALRRNGEAINTPEKDPVRKLGEQLFSESANQIIRFYLVFLAPQVMKAFNIRMFPKWTYQYMLDFVKSAINHGTEMHRGDFIDYLLGLRGKGPMEGNDGEMIEFDDDILASQMLMFLTAGYDTLGSGVTYLLYEAARNPDIQEKLRAEIHEVMNKYGGVVTYEGLKELRYMSKFINEVFRKTPPFTFIDRICCADYTIPGTNVVLKKGFKVIIPLLGLQNDEKYYENPDMIIPERFDDMEVQGKKPNIPFGLGPRKCLGTRFAMQGVMVALVGALQNHRLSVPKDSPSLVKVNPKRLGSAPLDKINVSVHALA